MFELIKKGILAGIGMAVLTKEKIEEATRVLVKEGKISTEEAEKLADDLVKSGQRELDDLNNRISDSMKKWADNVEITRKKEFKELCARVEALELKVSAMEANQTLCGGIPK